MAGRYVELIEGFQGHTNKFFEIDKISKLRRETEAYMSMYLYDSEMLDYFKDNFVEKDGVKKQSIMGYRGGVYANYIWLDIDDDKDLPKATKRARETIERINSRYDLNYQALAIYFSGMKGYSIGIPTSLFGGKDFKSEHIPAAFKLMAEDLIGSKEFDSTIYEHTRIFRLPNSRHAKTGMYKTQIDYNLILEEDLTKIKRLATDNIVELSYKFSGAFNKKLEELFKNSIATIQDKLNNVTGDINKAPIQENQSIFRIADKGLRNSTFHKAAYRLFAIPGLKTNEVTDIMKFIEYVYQDIAVKQGLDLMTRVELDASIKSAYDRTRSINAKKHNVTDLSSMIISVFNQIKNARYVPTGITSFDEDMSGGLELKNLYCFIGRGGTMKSIMLQDMQIEYAIGMMKNSIYFNMEMSDKLFFDRAFYKLFSFSFKEAVMDGTINEGMIEKYQYDIKEKVESRMFIVNETDIETKDMQYLIMTKQDEIKEPIDVAVIDSMNSMKMHGDNEAITAFKNTKYLKEVAKDTNTAIALINHATNACPETMRDCSPFCRGGSKPIDNSDAYFSLSKIVDKERSKNMNDLTNKNIIYKPGLVYVRMVNKRGTGNTINKVMSVDNNFNFIDSMLDPDGVETY